MGNWVRVCAIESAPGEGQVCEQSCGGGSVCLARMEGELHVLDNKCPHRGGPLGGGSIEGNAVVCPWHGWAFNVYTGLAEPPERARVTVRSVKVEDGFVLVDID